MIPAFSPSEWGQEVSFKRNEVGCYNFAMQNIYEKFEFSKISEKVAGYARSELGKAFARSLTMSL